MHQAKVPVSGSLSALVGALLHENPTLLTYRLRQTSVNENSFAEGFEGFPETRQQFRVQIK